jgi:formylglycine-generating enzyme required for sulfatase activity
MDQTEVTNAMYALCVEADFCQPPTSNYHFGDPAYDDSPVVYVDWNRAAAYCEWAGGEAKDVHLPSEAQWEYAARGGLKEMPYPWGTDTPVCEPGAENGANFSNCNNGPMAVKTFAPNDYSLYDMAGNVWEWVQDWYGAYPNEALTNPTGPDSGSQRVLRGGSWSYDVVYLRVSNRNWDYPDNSYSYLGFRCARSR